MTANRKNWRKLFDFARAIERAHGIPASPPEVAKKGGE
jgi:hypothetical protein